jgi:hypothetical protein
MEYEELLPSGLWICDRLKDFLEEADICYQDEEGRYILHEDDRYKVNLEVSIIRK